MNRAILVHTTLALAISLLFAERGWAGSGADTETTASSAALDRLFSATYAADEPGVAVLVRKGEHTLLRKGYGMADLELGAAIAPDMVFRLGSITKQFTAVAIMLLEQDGKLKVTDPVVHHLPDYPRDDITIEHLLTHTAGIPNYTNHPSFRSTVRNDLSVDEMVATWSTLDLEFPPGTDWQYSNSGYFLLGAVIEAAAGQDYESFVESRIFGPLGMTRSDYGSHDRVIPGRVRGYHRDESGYINAPYLSMTQPYAAGSLLSNVDDLAKWDTALTTEALLPRATRERMWTDFRQADGEEVGYGYGWSINAVDGQRVISHGGGIFGFSTMAIHVPEEEIFVTVLSNNPGHPQGPGLMARRAVDLLLGRSTAVNMAVDAATLNDYTGVYRIDDETTRAVTVQDGTLVTQRSGGGRGTPVAMGEDQFVYEDSLTRLQFIRDETGAVTAMDVTPWGGEPERAARTDEPLPEPTKVATVDPAVYDAHEGDYEIAPGFILTITRDGDRLMAQATGQGSLEILPESETVFFNDDIGGRITFQRDSDGVTTGLVLEQRGQRIEAARLP